MKSGGFSSRFRSGRMSEEDAENLFIHVEPMFDLIQSGGIAFENDIHVKTGIGFWVGHAAERAPIHFLNGLDFASRRVDLIGDSVDGFFKDLFLSRVI
jgi:Xaa-Pro aminopeptidase